MALQKVLSVAAFAAASLCGTAKGVDATGSNVHSVSMPVEATMEGVRGSATHNIPSKDGGFNFTKWAERRGPTKEEREEERIARSKRIQERRARARSRFQGIKPDPSTLTRMTREELAKMHGDEEEHPWLRKASWSWGGGVSGEYQAYGTNNMMDASEEYDKWAQAYRMVGGYIDCDHTKSDEGSHDSGDNNDGDNDGDSQACSRWMIWSSYVNPNYQGNEWYEYFGDDPTSVLDCHSPDTEWELLGVYRQEFYQFIEQISKHLWAIDDYEYIVALAGLAYMTDYDCFYVGADGSGNSIYAGVVPESGGTFRMGLYTDDYCIFENTNLGMTFDDFGLTSDVSLGSGDGDGGGYGYYNDVQEWWVSAQEYTLTDLNEVYDTFRYCTPCMDYPTYQDGYFIGDYGTDDDDLINQCWKFWSHDSYVCDGDCLAKAHAQGTILAVAYGGVTWGDSPSSYYTTTSGSASHQAQESKLSRLVSNIFLTLSFMVFVATFLAFAVARRSRHRERKSSKHRRLLDDDRRSRRRRHRKESGDGVFRSSKSRKSRGDREEGDGVFRSTSKSRRSESKSRKSSSRKSRSSSRRREKEDSGSYQPPNPDGEERRRSRSSSRKTSSRRDRDDDF